MGDMKAPLEAPLSVDKFRYHRVLLHNIRYAAQRLSAIRLTKLLLNKQASIAVATAPGHSRGNMLLHSTSITKRGLWAEVRQLVATPGICPACQTALRSREVTLTWGRVPLLWNSGTKLARRGCSDRAAPSCSIPIDPPHLLSRLHIIVSLWFVFCLFVFFQWLHCCCISSATILNLFLEHQSDCHKTATQAQNCHYQWKVWTKLVSTFYVNTHGRHQIHMWIYVAREKEDKYFNIYVLLQLFFF